MGRPTEVRLAVAEARDAIPEGLICMVNNVPPGFLDKEVMSSASKYECYDNPSRLGYQLPSGGPERRKSPRMPLHWIVYLPRHSTGRWAVKTKDISPEGFYCITSHSIQPGSRFECDIAVPSYNPKSPNGIVHLRCRVEAVRIEQINGGLDFGVACRIDDYRVICKREEC
jgi:hypothetical protein